MSKCRPQPTPKLQQLEQFGIELTDMSVTKGSRTARNVVITIPYEALRDEKDVQIAFQDLVTISSTE